MTSVLALDPVLSAAAGAAVVGFTPPSPAGSFNHSRKLQLVAGLPGHSAGQATGKSPGAVVPCMQSPASRFPVKNQM
eukprot:superscaffoldBa00003002_g15859